MKVHVIMRNDIPVFVIIKDYFEAVNKMRTLHKTDDEKCTWYIETVEGE